MSELKIVDPLDMEFQYYSCLIKDKFVMHSNDWEQKLTCAWFSKLSDPAYNTKSLREKRNRYLLMLTLCLLLKSLKYPFNKYPPEEALEEVTSFRNSKKVPAAVRLRSEMKETAPQTCDLHVTNCPNDDDHIGEMLDEQFEFLVGLAEPYISKLSDPSDRRRGRLWVTFLSSIDSHCLHMKRVRNDYAMLLSGYVQNDELPGPFIQSPIQKIVPLEDLVKIMDMHNHMVIDPSHPKMLRFFQDVPHPEEGAFAFIAVSGDICNTFVNGK